MLLLCQQQPFKSSRSEGTGIFLSWWSAISYGNGGDRAGRLHSIRDHQEWNFQLDILLLPIPIFIIVTTLTMAGPGSIDMLSSDWMAEGVAEVGLCLTDLTQLKPHPNLISTHQSIAETSPKHQHCLLGEISSKLCPKPILTSKPTVGRRKKVETWIRSGSFVGKGATNVVEQNGKVVQKMQIRKLGNEKKVRTTLVWQSWPTNWYGGEGLLN